MMDELELVKQARPTVAAPSSEARAAARRALERTIVGGGPRRRWLWPTPLGAGALVPALGVLVVAVVIAVFIGVHGGRPASSAPHGGMRLVFRVEPLAGSRVTPAAMAQTLTIVRERLDVSLPGALVSVAGDELVVQPAGRDRASVGLAEALAQAPGHLVLYDWEANVLAPSGRTVAGLLRTQDRSALRISQGASVAPGAPGAGSMSLYAAVELASRQRPRPAGSRTGPELFAFGAPGSSACVRAAHYYRVPLLAGQRCYLAGPTDALGLLMTERRLGVRSLAAQGVPQGWTVLQAESPSGYGDQLAWSDPRAQFFVLRDAPALSSADITAPQQARDQSGAPDVEFGFTAAGARRFQALTARVSHRGNLVSGFGRELNQHFAVALDDQLLTVPQIDFKAYPDGIPGNTGAVIFGPFTTQSARGLAAILRYGPLPVRLMLEGG
jgi:SecD/SecF fusion protein